MQRPQWLRRLTPVDGVAAMVAVAALLGVLWSPKLTTAVARATGSITPVQLSVDVRHLHLADPDALMQSIREEGQLSFVIRNQPAGSVRVLGVREIRPQLLGVQPDGSVVQAANPATPISIHARFDLEAEAESGPGGVVIAGTKLKIGVPVELEGSQYRVNGVVSGLVTP